MSADPRVDAGAALDGSGPDAPEVRGGRRAWARWAVTAVLVLLVGGYLAVAAYASGRIPSGTHVLGVDIGGRDGADALAALAPAVAEAGATPVLITLEDREAAIVPDEAGLAADAQATVDSLMGFSLNPYDLLRAFSGGDLDVAPVTTVDRDALVAAVDGTRDALDAGAVDAVVTVSSTGAAVQPGSEGVGVDVEPTADDVAGAWPVASVAAAPTPLEPAVTTDDARAFADHLNAQVLAGDVAMTGPNGDVTVTSDQLVRYGSAEIAEGELAFVVDGDGLAAELEAAQPDLVSPATDASFRFRPDHWLVTVESQPGRAIDGDALGGAVVAAAESADRTGELPYHDTEAAVTSEDLGVSDFKQKVAGFSTPLTPEPIRTKNLVRGAEKVTGHVVKPGETFSLTEALSPITAEGGYYPAHVIVDGYLADGIGGGLSQMATTLYNATYFAGLEDVEHRPHSKYFSRYPAGRESTIYLGAIDVKFKNDTPYALVLSSYVADDRLHVDIWSTPYYTVTTSASDRTNITKATTVESSHEGCINTPVGADGFTITNTREVYLDGELVDTSSYTWTYKPNDGVRCV